MLYNSLKITLRSLVRDRLYSGINIAGMALAIASCLILGIYLYGELTYDRHHVNHPRIFRVANAFQDYDSGNQRRALALTSPALGPLLKKDFPEVEQFVRLRPARGDTLLRHGERAFYWKQVFHADPAVFDVFTHKVLRGDARTALNDPLSVAISARVAAAYFGSDDPLGQTLQLDDGSARTVTLVYADLPDNTHLKYDVLFSYNDPALNPATTDVGRQLFGVSTYTYVLMAAGYQRGAFAGISTTVFQRYMETLARESTNRQWSGWLQPLAGIHLGEDLLGDQPTGNRYYLYGFAAVVVFILLIAAINYMNLATAGHARRARAVGIRKILGETRIGLLLQFLTETLLLVLVSLLVGTLIVELVLGGTTLSTLLGKLLTLDFVAQPALLVVLLGTGLLFTVLAGLYPAFYLSSFRPLAALSGNRLERGGNGELRLREGLLLLQFTIAIGVIACTLFMALQMQLVSGKPLGFDKDNRIVITLRDPVLTRQIPVLQQRLRQDRGISGVSFANSMMGQEVPVNSTTVEANDGSTRPVQLGHMAVGADFIDVMGMRIVEGRNFSTAIASDAMTGLLVNKALVDYMQWDQPIGKTLRATWGKTGTVIGVVDDFNFRSLHSKVEPFFLYQPEFSTAGRLGPERELVVHVAAASEFAATLAFIEKTLVEAGSQQPFEYKFLDDKLDALYVPEQRLMYLTGLFAAICIAVTCLGLFGLTTFTTEQRMKEIGVRRVLGASRWQIVSLLLKKTLFLVVAGAVLAALFVYPVMNAWLQNFAYRITLSPMAMLVATVAVLAIALGAAAAHILHLAGIAPTRTLRYE